MVNGKSDGDYVNSRGNYRTNDSLINYSPVVSICTTRF